MFENVLPVQSETQLCREVLSDPAPVAVVFFASWCVDCHQLSAVFSALADEYAPRVRFAMVNVDTAPEMERRHEIRLIPSVLLFREGRLTHRWENDKDPASYRPVLDALHVSG